MSTGADFQLLNEVAESFRSYGIPPASVESRVFPGETIFLIKVDQNQLSQAFAVSSKLESQLPPGYLLVVRGVTEAPIKNKGGVKSVNDERVTRLIELLNERSRTSEQQPSLQYVKDAAENLRVAVTRRHHVIFGRRGVGKTALLLEVKRQIEEAGALVLWINIQILRGLDARRAFLTMVQRLCELPQLWHAKSIAHNVQSMSLATKIEQSAQKLIDQQTVSEAQIALLVPACQRLIALLCAEKGADLYIFLDDLHYLDMNQQPILLDLIHGITRDTSAWIKITGIRNQCRIFVDQPPTGLQIGHDAVEIPLDITLEEPKKARLFLSNVLQTYLKATHIPNRSGFLSNSAIDRLVLASAGVPRDFLRLAARSIQIARLRQDARVVGAQDVNEAAGEAGKQKRSELEEDAAAAAGHSVIRLAALEMVRAFCIDENHCSFFLINLRDKGSKPEEYRLLQSLTDLRMIHLIKASLSDAHAAGERSEVYMLDLSEYSGSRLKHHLRVIELKGDTLLLRKTGRDRTVFLADTARKIIQALRTGPEFTLGSFEPLVHRH